MKTTIEAIPHGEQRYDTLGDYWTAADGHTYIFVSAQTDWRYEFLIGLHEYIEEAVTRHRGIAEKDIVAFDMAHPELDDPGMDPRAPYHKEHLLADAIEKILATELGVDWKDYERACAEVR